MYNKVQWGFPEPVHFEKLDKMAENDHNLYYDAWLSPRGILGYAESTTSIALTTTLTSLISETCTVEANRNILIGFHCKRMTGSGSGGGAIYSSPELYLYIDGVNNTYGYKFRNAKCSSGSITTASAVSFMWPLFNLNPGSHTFAIYGRKLDADTCELDADASAPIHMWIEDAGGLRNYE